MILSLIQCLRLLLQVFATYPNEDYDRRNEDVDPMAASAEYELEKRVERLDLFPVELEKGTEHYNVTENSCSLFPVLMCTGLVQMCLYKAAFRSLVRQRVLSIYCNLLGAPGG